MARVIIAMPVLLCAIAASCCAADLTPQEARLWIKQCREATMNYVKQQEERLESLRQSYAKLQSSRQRQGIARIEAELALFRSGRLIGPPLVRPLRIGQVGCITNLESSRLSLDTKGRATYLEPVTVENRKRLPNGNEDIYLSIEDGRSDNNSRVVDVVIRDQAVDAPVPDFVQVVTLTKLGVGADDDTPAEVVEFDMKPLEKLLPKKNWFVTPPAKTN